MTEDNKELIARIQAVLEKHAPPAGLSAAICLGRSPPIYFQAGHADIVDNEPINDFHVFGIGSITKVFVAVVVFQLIEEGKLKLSDRVEQYLSPHVLHDIDNASTATVQQLLGHTSGIDSWEDDPDWIQHGRGRLVQPEHIWSKTEPLDYIRRPRRTAPEPGQWGYANTNYTLLGLMIEVITQNTAEAEVRRRILEPLHLDHTYLEGFEPPQRGRVPRRYHLATPTFKAIAGVCPAFVELRDGLIEARGYNMSTSWTAGGMISSPRDLVTFARALRDGELLSEESMRRLTHWAATGRGMDDGLGVFRIDLPSAGRWLGHSGGVLGFSADLWWHEQRDCVICVLANVGQVHAGDVSQIYPPVVKSEFPALALQLVDETCEL